MNIDSAEGNNDTILSQDFDEITGYSVMFEDDGKTAYAYLILNGKITADVWLYNRHIAPTQAEWDDPSKLPFMNPREYAFDLSIEPISNTNQVQFVWNHDRQNCLINTEVFLRGELYGQLTPTSCPGWSKLAKKDGPLARVLEISNSVWSKM